MGFGCKKKKKKEYFQGKKKKRMLSILAFAFTCDVPQSSIRLAKEFVHIFFIIS